MKLLAGILVVSTVHAINARRIFSTIGLERQISGTRTLGTVEDKMYVTDNLHRNWSSSRLFCESEGMKLATISSNAQADYLKSVYDSTYFNGWYWIGARVNRNGIFVWIESEEKILTFKTLGILSWINHDEISDCLVYSSNNLTSGYYFRRACHHHHHLTLCESKQPTDSNDIEIENKEPKLIEIGSHNNKTYFGSQIMRNRVGLTRSYFAFHESRGLQLATIDNNDRHQTRFLKKACRKMSCDGWFWVAEKDVRRSEESSIGSASDIQQCHILDAGDKRLSRRPCYDRYTALCETLQSKSVSACKKSGVQIPWRSKSFACKWTAECKCRRVQRELETGCSKDIPF